MRSGLPDSSRRRESSRFFRCSNKSTSGATGRARWTIPLFSCYAFVRIAQTIEERLKVLRTPGVLGFVGSERQGTPIPDDQVENLQTAIREKIPCACTPLRQRRKASAHSRGIARTVLRESSCVRVKTQSVVVSVELLRRSLSIRLEGYRNRISLAAPLSELSKSVSLKAL